MSSQLHSDFCDQDYPAKVSHIAVLGAKHLDDGDEKKSGRPASSLIAGRLLQRSKVIRTFREEGSHLVAASPARLLLL